MAETAQIELAAATDFLLRESLIRKLNAFKAEIAGPAPSPLEKIIVDRIGTCWLQVHAADVLLVQDRDTSNGQTEFLQRRVERAQKNLLAATKQLCLVRQLLGKGEPRSACRRAAVAAPSNPNKPTSGLADSQPGVPKASDAPAG
jgi:hypothetical protein